MTNWRDTIMTHTEMCDRIDELEAENKALASRLQGVTYLTALVASAYGTLRDAPQHPLYHSFDPMARNVIETCRDVLHKALYNPAVVERHDSNG